MSNSRTAHDVFEELRQNDAMLQQEYEQQLQHCEVLNCKVAPVAHGFCTLHLPANVVSSVIQRQQTAKSENNG